jgi:hypothetical protein
MRVFAALFMLLACVGATSAQTVPELLTKHLYAGTLAEGDKALAAAGTAEAQAGQGLVRFVTAIEHLAQAMHRHGLATRSGGPMINLPILRIPVPPNAKPEKLDYAGFRAIFQRLVDDLDAAEAAMAPVGDAPVKFPIDLLKVRLDLDGDGKAADYEVLGNLMNNLAPGMVPPQAVIAFDTTDIYWLRGYSRFLSGFAQFMLAHDFHDTFDKTFHVFFPDAGLPLADRLKRADAPDAWADGALGDAIAFLHLINWPVAEPARLADVRLRLKAMAEMSRKSWAAARQETDNDAEWLPNAKQQTVFAGPPVTDEMINGWLAVMAEFDAILDGKKLLPHWRFKQGLNVKRMFEESKNFDFVLLIAGADAAPWLEDGPVSSSADWNSLMNVFQGNFLGYAMWFN